jgi:hypothetical protein
MTEHLKVNRKDKASLRGLLMMLNRRRKLLLYLERSDPQAHARLMERFGIRIGGGEEKVSRLAKRRDIIGAQQPVEEVAETMPSKPQPKTEAEPKAARGKKASRA